MKLNEEELNNVEGGMSLKGLFIVGGVLTFIIGLIDGITRPLKCN